MEYERRVQEIEDSAERDREDHDRRMQEIRETKEAHEQRMQELADWDKSAEAEHDRLRLMHECAQEEHDRQRHEFDRLGAATNRLLRRAIRAGIAEARNEQRKMAELKALMQTLLERDKRRFTGNGNE